jgi:type IV fimbrial biogenesis protein FimT
MTGFWIDGLILLTSGGVVPAKTSPYSLYYRYMQQHCQVNGVQMNTTIEVFGKLRPSSQLASRRRIRGFTLIELMIVVVIVAISLTLAVPTYQNIVEKRRVTNAAMQIASFLALTHGAAIKHNKVVAVSIKRDGSDGKTWCLGAMIKTVATDDCDCESTSSGNADYCDFNPDGAGAPILINQVGFQSFTMNGSSPNDDFNFYFDPVRGTKVADDGTTIDGNSHDVTLESTNEKYSLSVEISVTGRVRVCNPDSTKAVPGYKSC